MSVVSAFATHCPKARPGVSVAVSRGIAVRHVNSWPGSGGLGVPAESGGRRKVAGSAVADRVAGIESECVSEAKRNKSLLKSARASAQRRAGKNLPAPDRAATICLFRHADRRISVSVRVYAARLYVEFSTERQGGDGGGNGGRTAVGGYLHSVRKYVVPYCSSFACGPIVSIAAAFAAAILPRRVVLGSRETATKR